MKEKAIVSSMSLLASLGGYFYARAQNLDSVPYVMIAGFLGAMMGEIMVKLMGKNNDDEPPMKLT